MTSSASTLQTEAAAGAAQGQDNPAAVQIENLHFAFRQGQPDLLNIPAFSVSAGKQVFMAGPSGCGKSTLLGLIAGILLPLQGSVYIAGTQLNTMSGAERDRFRGDHIGYIFQQFNLIPYLSIQENVLLPCRFSRRRYVRAMQQCQSAGSDEETSVLNTASHLLTELDLSEDLWHKPVSQLSIGQQQRVAAARALIGCPELLIADEPTSALDTDRRHAFLQLLQEQCRRAGSALLFVSHDLSLAGYFDRQIYLPELNQAASQEHLS